MIRNVQFLRALAAYAVVCHHIGWLFRDYVAPDRFHHEYRTGSTGVQIFFALSGFVMMSSTSARRITAPEFLGHRIRRIVPAYWLVTAIVALLAFAGVKVIGCPTIDFTKLLSSLLFIPRLDDPAGAADPVLFVGWSLNYEVLFYGLFALCLAIAPRHRGWLAAAAIAGLWIVHSLFPSAVTDYLGADVVLPFAFGILVWPLARRWQPGCPMTVATGVVGLLCLVAIDVEPMRSLPHVRVISSIGAALLLFSAVAAEKAGISMRHGFLVDQGDTSYSLYLIHPLVLQIIAKAWIATGLASRTASLILIVPLMLAASGIAAACLHACFDRPVQRAFARLFARRPINPAAGPVAS